MFKKYTKKFKYGSNEVTLETGLLARQATSSVLVSMNETVVLVTVVANKTVKEGQSFFPLVVDYFEKTYAVGRVPGGFIKRETKPSEHEVLVARLIDRAIRPLFPEGFYHDVQIVAQVIALNPEVSADVVANLGVSAALCLAGLPFKGPIATARVGYIDEQFVLNPTDSMLPNSLLDLVVSGTDKAILMVESEARELPEDIMLNAIMYGHEQLQVAINAIDEFVRGVNPPVWEWQESPKDDALFTNISNLIASDLAHAYNITTKQERVIALEAVKNKALEAFVTENSDTLFVNRINQYISELEANIVRGKILNGEPRIDGRDTKTVRPIDIQTSFLARTHGSAVFTRGETQALAIVTLGTKSDEQIVENILKGTYSERFLLHYNFPPFSTGDVGRMGPPKRREVGHGNLAKRALKAVLPEQDLFPYSIRVVSEILESNGSSSMATVCGGSLCMMDAGVPLKAHVAGVAMGLIMQDNKVAVLTDILGDEDHLGDMDFKVAGTEEGVTALQMDIKIAGITRPILHVALKQAREGRMHILKLMNEALPRARVLSDRVPRMHIMQIKPEKVRDVIGKGGSVIKAIIADTGATVDLSDDGKVVIAASSRDSLEKAIAMVANIVAEVKLGDVYDGVVTRILDRNAGAMVAILGSREGFVHISQIANERIDEVRNYLREGQEVRVKVVEFDDRGRMRLSIRALLNVANAGAHESSNTDASVSAPLAAPANGATDITHTTTNNTVSASSEDSNNPSL